jgi:hypothetical protein
VNDYPAALVGACILGATGAAIGNTIKEQDVQKCALGGLATGAFAITAIYLYQVITGTAVPR